MSAQKPRFADIFSIPSATGSPAKPSTASPLSQVWNELSSIMAAQQAAHKRKADEASEVESVFQAKIDGLLRFQSVLQSERQTLVNAFNSKKAAARQPLAVEETEAFWTKLADLDGLLDRTATQIDDARLKMYFPPAKGYTYRMAAPGVYLAVGDFWLSQFRARFSVEVVPGQGQCWLPGPGHGQPPGISLKAAPVSVSLLVLDLGLRGDNIPSQLRHIKEIELTAEVDISLPLAFVLPPTPNVPGQPQHSHAQQQQQQGRPRANTHTGPAVNALSKHRWTVIDSGFKFEVTKLECKTKGTGVPVPTSLLKMLINSLVPPQIKTAVTSAVPNELGMLLALQADHFVHFTGELSLQSVPMDVLHANLDEAIEAGPLMYKVAGGSSASSSSALSAPAGPGSPSKAQAMMAAAGVRTLLGLNLRSAAVAGPGQQQHHPSAHIAGRAANALGLSALQARAFIAAQQAVPQLKGTPVLRTAGDVVEFVSKFNPKSSHRRIQATAAGPGASVTGISSHQRASEAAEEAAWNRLVDLWQRLLDEYSQKQLQTVYEQAMNIENRAQQKAMTTAAQQRMVQSSFSLRQLFDAAEALYTKPVRLHITVHDFLLRMHAETAIGLSKSIALRGIKAKQSAATAAASTGAPVQGPTASSVMSSVVRPPPSSTPQAVTLMPAAQATNGQQRPGAAAVPASGARSVAGGAAAVPASGAMVPSSQQQQSQLQLQQQQQGPTSLIAQLEGIQEWAKDALSQARLVHSYLTRATASTSGWLTGGERGQLAVCVRQVQIECAQGISLPLPMNEGFFPPGTTVTAMESRDEYSEALGWAAAGAQVHGAPAVATAATAAAAQQAAASSRAGKGRTSASTVDPNNNRGRGTFSVMLCWPRKDASSAGALGMNAGAVTGRSVSGDVAGALVDQSTGLAAPSTPQRNRSGSGASSSVGLSSPQPTTPGYTSASSQAADGGVDMASSLGYPGGQLTGRVGPQQPPALAPSDVEVLATIKIHRAWMGLRIDEAALLSMVHQRAAAVEAGLYSGMRGLPALHALEVSFRPSVVGSSYTAHGAAAHETNPASLLRKDTSLASLGGEMYSHGGDVPPFPYVIGLETPNWTRAVAEIQALEASGDVPVLVKQVGQMFQNVLQAASNEQGDEDDESIEDEDVDGGDGMMLRDDDGTGTTVTGAGGTMDDGMSVAHRPSVSFPRSLSGDGPSAPSLAAANYMSASQSGAGIAMEKRPSFQSRPSFASTAQSLHLGPGRSPAPSFASTSNAIAAAADAALQGIASPLPDGASVPGGPAAAPVRSDAAGSAAGGALASMLEAYGVEDGGSPAAAASTPAVNGASTPAAASSEAANPFGPASGAAVDASTRPKSHSVATTASSAALPGSASQQPKPLPVQQLQPTAAAGGQLLGSPPPTRMSMSEFAPGNPAFATAAAQGRGRAPSSATAATSHTPANGNAIRHSTSGGHAHSGQTREQRQAQRDARKRYKDERRAQAAAARDVASAEFSLRVGRYLKSDDLRIAVNLFMSLLSVPAPPIAGIEDDPDEGLVIAGTQAAVGKKHKAVDAVLADIAGIDSSHIHHPHSGASNGRRTAADLRKVLSLSISSKHSMQPTLVPQPGSANIATQQVQKQQAPTTAPAASPQPQKPVSAGAPGPVPVVLAPSSAAFGSTASQPPPAPSNPQHTHAQSAPQQRTGQPAAAHGHAATSAPVTMASPAQRSATSAASASSAGATSKSAAPVLTAPAIAVDLQISLLTLLEDISVVRSAMDTAGAISASI